MDGLDDGSSEHSSCGCFPDCMDIASGVFMHRHGLTADEGRGVLQRAARRQARSIHQVAKEVLAAAAEGRAFFPA